jgi:hypothetical protein
MSLFERLLLDTSSSQWMLFLEGDGFLVDNCILQRQPKYDSFLSCQREFFFHYLIFAYPSHYIPQAHKLRVTSLPFLSPSTCGEAGDCAEARTTFHWGSLSQVLTITIISFYYCYNNGYRNQVCSTLLRLVVQQKEKWLRILLQQPDQFKRSTM